jgi:glycosyltransferase involved in cell wall biosynthesis
MIRVLHVLDELRRSGAELRILRAAPLLRAAGVTTSVVATGREVGTHASAFHDADVDVHHLVYRPRPGYLIELARLVRAHADIVQFHTERAFIFSELTCRLVGVQVVHAPCSIIRIGGAWRWRRVAQRWLARRCGIQMVATSDSVAANEAEWFHNPTRLVRNYLATDAFTPTSAPEVRAALGLPADTPVVISVGNCHEVKNHPAILAALARVPGDWRYLHVGEEPDETERRIASSFGIAERCRFLGVRDDVAELLRAADVFVMTSHVEGLGVAALEAAACGLVLVLSDVAGLRDLAPVATLAVWTGTDPTSIAAGVHQGLSMATRASSEDRWQQHGAIARRYGLERGVDGYLTLYRELAAGVPARSASR